MDTEQVEIQVVEVAPKAKAKKAQKTTKPATVEAVAPKAKAKPTPQAAYDNAIVEVKKALAVYRVVKSDSLQSPTDSAKRAVYEAQRATLKNKFKSKRVKMRGLNTYITENSFATNAAKITAIAEKLAESAKLANGNILDASKHVGAGFFDSLACVVSILGRVDAEPMAPWADWLASYECGMNEYLLTPDFRDVCSFLLSKFAPKLVGALEYVRHLDKSAEADDTALHANLLKVATEYILPKCFIGDTRNALHTVLTRLSVEDIKRGEVIKPLIVDGVEVARPLLQTKAELKAASERVTERVEALQDNIVSSHPFDSRVGIFSGINALTKALESGLKAAKNKAAFTVDFFVSHNRAFLQAALDSAINEAILGACKADKSQLSALNSLVSAFSIEITPNNAQQSSEYILGGADIVRYVQFVCPWLGYKKDDGGFFEKPKSASPKTAHIGPARPIWRGVEGDVVQYPAITLVDYLRLLKTVSKETRVKNQAIRKANAKLSGKPKA